MSLDIHASVVSAEIAQRMAEPHPARPDERFWAEVFDHARLRMGGQSLSSDESGQHAAQGHRSPDGAPPAPASESKQASMAAGKADAPTPRVPAVTNTGVSGTHQAAPLTLGLGHAPIQATALLPGAPEAEALQAAPPSLLKQGLMGKQLPPAVLSVVTTDEGEMKVYLRARGWSGTQAMQLAAQALDSDANAARIEQVMLNGQLVYQTADQPADAVASDMAGNHLLFVS
jgi:hypothetical protein